MPLVITNDQFQQTLKHFFQTFDTSEFQAVTGPGRSGAIASVFVSHLTGLPFFPYGQLPQANFHKRLLIVDTASQTGKTMRKAVKKYDAYDPHWIHFYEEPPRVVFWYEV